MRRPSVLIFILTALLGLAAASPAAAASTPAGPQAVDRPLRVATYNIHHAQGADGVLDLERIAQVLSDSGADVIGLQEVDRHWGERSENLDQAAWLGERLGMHVIYGANLDLAPTTAGAPKPAVRHRDPVALSDPGLDQCAAAAVPEG